MEIGATESYTELTAYINLYKPKIYKTLQTIGHLMMAISERKLPRRKSGTW